MSESNRNSIQKRVASLGWLGGCLCLPWVMAFLVLWVSPNYQVSEVGNIRTAPLGGDFLQEWVGATIVGSTDREKLYDLNYSTAVQHDVAVVGFEWPDQDYFPMVYPPFYYQALRPLAALEYVWAMKVWLLVSGLAISLSLWLLFRFYEPFRKWLVPGTLAAMLFVPLLTCFNMGQKSTIILLILTATFVLFHRKKPFESGLVFGLIAFKPHLGLVIGLSMLFKRQWQFAAGAVLTVVAMVVLSFYSNPPLWYDYAKVVGGMNNYVETGGYQLADSHSLWGAVQLTFSNFNAPGWLVKSMVIILGGGVVFLLWRVMRGQANVIGESAFAAMVLATVMLSPHFYSYDLTILLLPMLLIATVIGKQEPHSKVKHLLGLSCVGLFVFAGMFKSIAAATTIQLSIPLMVGVLILLGSFDQKNRPADGTNSGPLKP